MEKALFYEQEWNCFNNFSAFMVHWKGILWRTVEHAYQAAKFRDEGIIFLIKNATSPYEAKKIPLKFDDFIREDWHEINTYIMESILREKLKQHSYIQKKLLKSVSLELIEDSPIDSFWGRGPDWKGKNMLGKIWMKLRDELISQDKQKII